MAFSVIHSRSVDWHLRYPVALLLSGSSLFARSITLPTHLQYWFTIIVDKLRLNKFKPCGRCRYIRYHVWCEKPMAWQVHEKYRLNWGTWMWGRLLFIAGWAIRKMRNGADCPWLLTWRSDRTSRTS
jgi:hypothetical protein